MSSPLPMVLIGEGHALQMRNEILETVEQRGVLQNTGIDAQMEETGNREMLMNNVQEKDLNEQCDELTEGEASAVTVRDNGDADQIERAAANLDDGKQSACDTQSLGGKEVSEEIWHTLGSGGGMQCCGNMEESESDLGVNEKHMQENVNQKLDHDERSQIEVGDPRSHGGTRKEKCPEVRNDIDVLCDDSDGAEADNQPIVEETQKVAQQVPENTIGILQQHLCSCDLQEESRDEGKEVTQEGVGSIQVREDNLTGMQEQSAEVVHVRQKELGGSEEMGKEQEAMREVGFHVTTKESCSGNFTNEVATEMTLIGEENKAVVEVENRAIGDVKSYGGDEVKWHEENKENVQNTGEARTLRRNEDMAHIKNQGDEREIEGLDPNEGKDRKGDKNEGIDQGNDRE
eukprot:g27740.t1